MINVVLQHLARVQKEEMNHLNLPDEIQNTIKKSLQSQGHPRTESWDKTLLAANLDQLDEMHYFIRVNLTLKFTLKKIQESLKKKHQDIKLLQIHTKIMKSYC